MKRFRLKALILSILVAIVVLLAPAFPALSAASDSEKVQPSTTEATTPQPATHSEETSTQTPESSDKSQAEKQDPSNQAYDRKAIQEFDRQIYGAE